VNLNGGWYPVLVSPSRRADLGLISVTAIWGMSFPIIRYTVTGGSTPLAFVAARFALASLVMLPFAWRQRHELTKSLAVGGAMLGVLFGAAFVMQTIGMTQTTAAKSGFITSTTVVMVPFLDRLLRGAPLRAPAVSGAMLALAGVYVLGEVGDPRELLHGHAGDLWTLGCALAWGVYMIRLQDQLARFPHRVLLEVQLIAVASSAALGSIAVEQPRVEPTPLVLLGLAYLSVISTVLSSLLHFRYQARTTPARAAVIFTLEPVFAAASAALLLDEPLHASTVVGGALIIGGLLVSEVGGLRT
jgi:drug/metabolite transporter (DMT)-like permease